MGIFTDLKLPSEALSEDRSLSMLLYAVKSADLVTTLDGASNVTIFAPDDDAFKQIQEAYNDLTKPANKVALVDFLLRHVVLDATWTDDKLKREKQDDELEMASGEKVKISFDKNNILHVRFGDAVDHAKSKGSITVRNGVIHILTSALGSIIYILGKYSECVIFTHVLTCYLNEIYDIYHLLAELPKSHDAMDCNKDEFACETNRQV